MRHPLTGGGMTVAFSDVVKMKSMLSPLPSAPTRRRGRARRHFYAHRPSRADINTLANALYKVFCSSTDSSMEEMRRACFSTCAWAAASGAHRVARRFRDEPANADDAFFSVALFGVGG